MHSPKEADEFELAPRITAGQYKVWAQASPPCRAQIANMIKARFGSRFLEPVMMSDRVKGGFAAIALSCLAIQALDSFRNGNAESNTAAALQRFIRDNPEFLAMRGYEHAFYSNVRNALHHQAETRKGWRIHISGPVFEPTSKVVGAQSFVDGFRSTLSRYCLEIEHSNDDSPVWKRLVVKMGHVLKTCDSEAGVVGV